MSEFEQNLTATENMIEAEKMLKIGVPLSVIAKTFGIQLSSIQDSKNEKANNNE